MNKRIELDDVTRKALQSFDVIPDVINIRGNKYYPKDYIADGYKGVVWKGIDDFDGDVAIKFTIHEDYMARSYLEEAENARKLKGRVFFADFYDAGIVELSLTNSPRTNFVVFIEEWIEGCTLSSYLNKQEITSAFFASFVKGMCYALNILYTLNLRHDDLHSGNIMVAQPKLGDIDRDELKIKIIDMGSLKSADLPLHKEKDDHGWFTEHLITIRNLIRKSKAKPLHELLFIKEIDQLLNRMVEEDRTVALCEPTRIISEFENALIRSQHPVQDESILIDPFDYIASEHIASDKLLVELFAESCPWFKDVSGPNPILLTGPRGCGKSMVFRRLSLKALLSKDSKDLANIQIAGFYISCSSDLRNRFGWLTEVTAHKFRKEVVHYFNLLLVREVVQTLISVARHKDRNELFGFNKIVEKRVRSFLFNKLGVTTSEQLHLQGVTPMEHTLSIIETKMDKCYQDMIRGFNTANPTNTAFISEFTRHLSQNIFFFRKKKITFLVDDFSIHRIPREVQMILNPIIWDRQATHIFKLSAEKYGAVGLDELNGLSEMTREMREIDCGQYFINVGNKEGRIFARELLAIRLSLAGYDYTPEDILGNSNYEEGSLGLSLRHRKEAPGRIDNQYYGLQTIADICSGDISILLEIYRRIFEYGNIKKEKVIVDSISNSKQHQAITSVSRELLNLIKNYVPYGSEMHQIVVHFGTLSRRILREGYLQKKEEKYIPCETSRIELHQPPGQPGDKLTNEQQELMDELVRRSIFIEMELGRGRRKFTPTLRWQLRKVYCPAFGTSLSKNTAIKWNTHEFKRFLIDPEATCKAEFKKRWLKKTKEDLHISQTTIDDFMLDKYDDDEGIK